MGYSIVENSTNSFIENRSIKLPRFQRKQTWKPTDNFKLCISVFKGYPIGVVIINSCNKPDRIDWLLDGRQRRNALKLIKENPVELYHWAKKFANFNYTESEEELKKKFWSAIDVYLQNEFGSNSDDDNNDESDISEESDDSEDIEYSFNVETQYSSLKSLLDLILIIHPYRNKKTRFEKMFLFDGIIPEAELDYTKNIDGEYIVDSEKLKKHIQYLIDNANDKKEEFTAFLIKRYKLSEKQAKDVLKYIDHQWEYYEKCFAVTKCTDEVIQESSIGVIKLTNASVLDAQNIFSLVNAGGTPLTKEELLSARPFWNIPLENPSGVVKDEVKKMYQKLDIDVPNDVYRWDLGATFLSRIDKNHIIFDNLNIEKDTSFKEAMSLGFRLISAIYTGGINNNNITNLEKKKIDWDVDIDKLVNDINDIINRLEQTEYFKYLQWWNKSIMSITSNTIAIEYITILYKLWIGYERPKKSTSKADTFIREAMILCDRLIYEYTIRIWSGSSDSRLSGDIKNYKNRIIAIKKEEWIELINELSTGKFKGKSTSVSILKAFMYHYYIIKKIDPVYKNSTTIFEIDHIVAQSLFKDNDGANQDMKDCIINLALLPKGENIEKSDKRLNKITDEWLKKQIIRLAEISEDDFETFSDITNINQLKEKRAKLFSDAFSEERDKLINN
ncbi:DUF262 domain-containing protein [Clostridium sulfidigenes]|uniref:DUF262 domain-containing protein n=1 Tax=Clostridium sulfidigenes TaxID=318464 RepID=UPI003F88A118